MKTSPRDIKFSAALAGFLSLIIVLGQMVRNPSGVRDIVTGNSPEVVRLVYPLSYVFFAPFLHFADHFTILSLNQHIALFILLNLIWILRALFFPSLYSGAIIGRQIANFFVFNLA